MTDRDTPLRLVRKWTKAIPTFYDALDRCYQAKVSGRIQWPDACPIPIAAAADVLQSAGMPGAMAGACAAECTACWAWRRNKVIYRFDRTLVQALLAQSASREEEAPLSAELLFRLPSACVYIKTPGMLDKIDGFFAWIEYDMSRKTLEFRVQLVTEDMTSTTPLVMHLDGDTIDGCVQRTVEAAMERMRRMGVQDIPEDVAAGSAAMIHAALQLVLYLVAVNADIRPELTSAKKKAHAERSIGADQVQSVRCYDVGVGVGAALRRTAGSADMPERESLCGQWRQEWVDEPGSDRKLTLRWLAPTGESPGVAEQKPGGVGE